MSVDDRLREAFGTSDPAWQARASDALAEVTARHRRESFLRRVAASGAVAATVAVAVGALIFADQDSDGPPPVAPDTRTPSPSLSAAEYPLDGTWSSGPIVRADVEAAATAAGDPGDLNVMLEALPTPPFRVVLVIDEANNSVLLKLRADGEEQVFDEANVEVTEGQLVLNPRFASGTDVHSWTLRDQELRLAFMSTTEGDAGGVPAEAWQRLLYDSSEFTR